MSTENASEVTPKVDTVLPNSADPLNLCYTNCGDTGQKERLQSLLEKDLLAADLRWTFFVSACHSYRHDSGLRPFPPSFMTESSERDIDRLREVVSTIPSLKKILQCLKLSMLPPISTEAMELIMWVMCNTSGPELCTIPEDQKSSIIGKSGSTLVPAVPSHIVQVTYGKASDERWNTKDLKSMFAFHGSRLDNFHSILHHGLQQHMNKNSLFGSGIYLSNELSVSMPYSPTGEGWQHSVLGEHLSCIALCELLDHPDVKCHTKTNTDRSYAPDSVGGEVPDKYFVVVNNELVRVRYLLVFCREQRPLNNPTVEARSWVSEHKFFFVMLAYVMILVAVGIRDVPAVTRTVHRWVKYWTRPLQD